MNDVINIGGLECSFVRKSAVDPQLAVILCHGFGAPGTDLVAIANEIFRARASLGNSVFVFPQAPLELDPHYDSRAWWMIDIEEIQERMMSGQFRELRGSVPPALNDRSREIFSVIEFVKAQFSLPACRIVVGGFSQGAMLTTDVALTYPETLGGLIVWSGTLINEAAWIAAAGRSAKLRIVLSHGRSDPILPFAGAELLRDMLREQGHEVKFVPFNGQHAIGAEALAAAIELLESVPA